MSNSEPLLRLDRLSVAWEKEPVVRSVSLEVHEGEYLTLLGPNGAGKSTLLRCIGGFEPASEGRVLLRGADLARVPPYRRGIGLMFQDPALFAHRSVYENIAYPLLLRRAGRAQVEDEVGRLLALLRLGGFEDRDPATLSGGERQRVALARTLAARPSLVLLDEPFASIDVELKAELRTEFRAVLRSLGTAAIHVTHDREEGLFLGDRVALMFEGRIDTLDDPRTVFSRPRTARSAAFLGYNVVRGPRGSLAVHPTEVAVDVGGADAVPLTVVAAGPVGPETLLVLSGDDGTRIEARLTGGLPTPRVGTHVNARWTRAIPVAG